jgi:hypothetical protein
VKKERESYSFISGTVGFSLPIVSNVHLSANAAMAGFSLRRAGAKLSPTEPKLLRFLF